MLYIGIRGRVDEKIVPAEGIPFRAISAGALRVSSPLTFAGNALRLGWGVMQSLWILLRFRPNAVFATGGYASVPVGVAARLLRRPLWCSPTTPGWAVRLLSRLATRMSTTSERALASAREEDDGRRVTGARSVLDARSNVSGRDRPSAHAKVLPSRRVASERARSPTQSYRLPQRRTVRRGACHRTADQAAAPNISTAHGGTARTL
jgi:UDP-N-acetylglucosamine:LPS N-acetylglucosamine transferase